MVGYYAVDDRSRSRYDNDDDGSELNLSTALSQIIDEQEIDFYKAILKSEYAEREKMLETRLEQARVTRVAISAGIVTSNLAAEQAGMEGRLGQITMASGSTLRPAWPPLRQRCGAQKASWLLDALNTTRR